MDLRTSYRDTYIPLKPLSARNVKRSTSNVEQVFTRPPMHAISQTSFDFRPYPNYRPSPPVEMEPFLSQITIGNSFTPSITLVFDLIPRKKNVFFLSYRKSQYRSDYEGIDTSLHHREPPASHKDQQKVHIVPSQKMDTLTVTQVNH